MNRSFRTARSQLQAVSRRQRAFLSLIMLVALLGLLSASQSGAYPLRLEPEATFVTLPASSIDGYFATAWGCPEADPGVGVQTVLQFHRNWHCNNPDHAYPQWGAAFFGFHKQFTFGFDTYRDANGFARVQTWDPAPDQLIPFEHGSRPANTPCSDCFELSDEFKVPSAGGTLDSFASSSELGDAIVNEHNITHGLIAGEAVGPVSDQSHDMNYSSRSPRDPIFWPFHNKLDEIQEDWLSLQETDIAVVFDRSGSMSGAAVGGGTRLAAAKDAANMFADLLEDGTGHEVGLVTFSSSASAAMPLTSVAAAPAAMSAAVSGITAIGNTSIGAGLATAQTMLDAGSNDRKAILLLTDGKENTAPMISTVEDSLGSTHLCSVGLGTPESLDGPKLRDLSERQGGIYVSGPSALELKKFFVDCFADIFDTFVGEDPITTLPAAQLASAPTIHTAYEDDKLVFVLGWSQPAPAGTLRLAITSPNGVQVDLSDPAVESEFGPTWHIVRFRAPFHNEQNGKWQARAVRSQRSFVNGFSPDAFKNPREGRSLVLSQIGRLCPSGCANVLYYADGMAGGHGHHSAYNAALGLWRQHQPRTNVVEVGDPAKFATQLQARTWDLVIYNSQHTQGRQAYDSILNELACSVRGPQLIVSDNRAAQDKAELFRCLGAVALTPIDWTSLVGDGQLINGTYTLVKPAEAHMPFSYALGTVNGGVLQARNAAGLGAIVALGTAGVDQQFFISALQRSVDRVRPFTLMARTYTGEALHPAFRITESFWPAGGFDKVTAQVSVTRPLRGVGNLLRDAGATEGGSQAGDAQTPRDAALLRLDPKQTGLIPTETRTFPLYDDGTNGDGYAGDRYWEVQLPPSFTQYDGQYHLHAVFNLCKAGYCIQREARQDLTVDIKQDLTATAVRKEQLTASQGRNRTRIVFTPRDAQGNYVGPDLLSRMILTPSGDARIELQRDTNGRGEYEVILNWTAAAGTPRLAIGQYGRPKDVLAIALPPNTLRAASPVMTQADEQAPVVQGRDVAAPVAPAVEAAPADPHANHTR